MQNNTFCYEKQIIFKFEIKETYILLLEQVATMEATTKKMIQTMMMMQVILKRKVKRKMIPSEIFAILLI